MITVLSDGTCRARKPHRCDLDCGEKIVPGEVHHRQGCVDGGRAYTFRAHLHCHALSLFDFWRGDRTNDDGLNEVSELCMEEWSRADIETACDRQRWAPSHPGRERARALWQRFASVGAPRMGWPWWSGKPVPGTALEVRR